MEANDFAAASDCRACRRNRAEHGLTFFSDPAETTPEVSAEDADYVAGRKALEAKNWPSAIKSFSLAAERNSRNADVQNYLGFAYRKTGKLDLAFKHYNRALALNPRHRGAHEYIGEAYLIKGDVKSAQKHLAALREICSLPCEELTDLERDVAKHLNTGSNPIGDANLFKFFANYMADYQTGMTIVDWVPMNDQGILSCTSSRLFR